MGPKPSAHWVVETLRHRVEELWCQERSMGLGAGPSLVLALPWTGHEALGKSADLLGIGPLICGRRETRLLILAGLWGESDDRMVVKVLCKLRSGEQKSNSHGKGSYF